MYHLASPRVLIALLAGVSFEAMAAAPLAESTQSAKAWQPTHVSKASYKHFLQPLGRMQSSKSQAIARGNWLRGRRGRASAVPEIAQVAEAGKIFDFNLTLPAMAAQILALMLFLDKTWFGPVGKVLDDREAAIRNNLNKGKEIEENNARIKKEREDAARAARAKAKAEREARKKAEQDSLDAAVGAARAKNEKELAVIKAETEEMLKDPAIEVEAKKLADEMFTKILVGRGVSPANVTKMLEEVKR